MTANDFDSAFGTSPAGSRTSFTERVGRADAPPPADSKEAASGTGIYKAYGYLPTNTVGETCDVQRWLNETDVAEGIEFQYRFLMQIGYVGDEQIRLFLPDCIVVIDGKNLRELRKKLARRQVTFVQQYTAKIWGAAPSPSETIIHKIQVVRPND